MSAIPRDLSIFNKFNFERKPVGVKYMLKKPDGIGKLGKTIAFCEMLKEAQQSAPFYVEQDNFECVGPFLLGMEEPGALFESGQLGPRLGVFEEARANSKLYEYIPILKKKTVKYVVFAPLNKITFSPDVLVISATPEQAEIILRASSYTSGKMWQSKLTPVVGCSWIFLYPYVSGEINYIITNLVHGMKGRQVLPDGVVVISIPFNVIPMVIENLNHMEWVLPEYTRDRDANSRAFDHEIEEMTKEFGSS